MTDMEKAFDCITQQQEKLKNTQAFFVGEQLKEILQGCPDAAAMVLQDLQVSGMGVADCEKEIRAYAQKNGGCCPGKESDRIIREFYGIPKPCTDAAPAKIGTAGTGKKKISVLDFM